MDALNRAEIHGLLDLIDRTVKSYDLGNIHALLVPETAGTGFSAAAAGNAFIFVNKEFPGHYVPPFTVNYINIMKTFLCNNPIQYSCQSC